MRTAFINDSADCTWLRETHLSGVQLPAKWSGFQSFVLQGNEDCPHAVNLYLSADPYYTDDYFRVRFDNGDEMIHVECAEYCGKTDAPYGGLARID